MRRVVADTDVISEALRGKNTQVLDRIAVYVEEHGRLDVSEITWFEVRTGLLRKNATKQLEAADAFLRGTKLLPLRRRALDIAAQECARLENQGRKIGDPGLDLFIGATALSLGFGVATGNRRHFERLEGLEVEDWMAVEEPAPAST